MGGSKAVVAAVVLAIAGSTAYYLFTSKQKREQQRQVSALLAETTRQLRQALNGPPTPDLVSRIDSNLKLAKAPRDRQLETAAEHYIHGAREIARKRSDAAAKRIVANRPSGVIVPTLTASASCGTGSFSSSSVAASIALRR